MNSADEGTGGDAIDPMPDYLRQWPGLYTRKGAEIIEASPEDSDVARAYPVAVEKGDVVKGKRLTILTKKKRYAVGEEIRVVHVMEIVEPGHRIFAMGPKPIHGEYIDDIPATPEVAAERIYDGLVMESPNVDYNYDITSYRFDEPGEHRIYWQMDGLRSNTITLEILS